MTHPFGAKLIALALLLGSPAMARTLHVAQQDLAAADTNPGTKEKPFRTISAAAAQVLPGDHVVIHGGTYRETVIITNSGTESEPIVFGAAEGEVPVIMGSDRLS